MRIARQTATELVLEDSGLWLAGALAIASLPLFYAAIFTGAKGNFVVAGFFVICSLVGIRKSSFVFDAGERVVRWKNRLFLKASSGSVAFDEIREIGIECSSAGEGGAGYRLTILTPRGSIPQLHVRIGKREIRDLERNDPGFPQARGCGDTRNGRPGTYRRLGPLHSGAGSCRADDRCDSPSEKHEKDEPVRSQATRRDQEHVDGGALGFPRDVQPP